MSGFRGAGWKGALFCAPAVLLLLFSVVVPFLAAVAITFTDQRLLSPHPTRFVGGDNYARLLSLRVIETPLLRHADGPRYQPLRDILRADPSHRGYRPLYEFQFGKRRWFLVATDPVFYRSLLNTFQFAAMVVPLQTLLALGMALLVNPRWPGRVLFRALFFAPVVSSMVVVSVVWSFLYNQHDGVINQALAAFFGNGTFEGPDWLGHERLALPAIVLMSAWQGAGFQMLIFLAGLQSVDPALYEAAALDGANRFQRFLHVTLPGLRNTTVFVAITTTIAALGLFTQVDIMTGGGPNDATSTLIFHAVRSGFREQDVAYGATVAVLFFALTLSLALFQRALAERRRPEAA